MLSSLARQTAPDATIAITDVTLINATGAPPHPRSTVVIEGDRITEIRSSSSGVDPEGASIVDGTGRYLIPGLWDAHVHTFVVPWQPDHQLPLFIANGVTGIRDMGGAFPASANDEMGGGFPMDAIDAIRAAIASRERVGPRIVAGVMVDGPTPVWPVALAVGTAEEEILAELRAAAAGPDPVQAYAAAFFGMLPRFLETFG
jgi:hypothetical protein